MNFWQALLNFIYPRRCPHCKAFLGGDGSWCKTCLGKNMQVRRLPLGREQMRQLRFLYALGLYRGTLGDLIRDLKYKRKMHAAEALADFVQQAAGQVDFPSVDLVFYVPLHEMRYKERGFNQVEEIFRPLVLEKGWPVGKLLRSSETAPQYGLTAQERRSNLRGAFTLQADVTGKDCLLLDDIATSGATLLEAARLLKRQGAHSVCALVVASDK